MTSLAVLQRSSPPTEVELVPEGEWEHRQRERENREAFERLWPLAQAPIRAYQRILANDLRGDEWHKVNRKLATLVQPQAGKLLALVGHRGPGKTQLGVCAMHRLCQERGRPVRYVKAIDFFADIRAAFGRDAKESERDVLNRFCKPSLLIIDAMEERSENAWENRMLSHLIDRRYDNLTNTILISNVKVEDFESSIGASAASRLNECGGVFPCHWPSFRE